MARGRVWWLAGAGLAAGAGGAMAQPDDQPDEPIVQLVEPKPETKPGVSPYGFGATEYTLRAYTSYEDGAQLKSDPGEVSVFRAGMDFSATMPVDEASRLRLRAGAEYSNFDFKSEQKIAVNGVSPVEELSSYKLGLGYERDLGDQWSIIGRGMLRDGIEGGAKVVDGLAGDISGGVLWEQQPGIKIGIGMTAFWRVGDYTRFLPVPLVDIDKSLSEHWKVVVTIPEWAGFVYTPSNVLTLNLGVGVRWQDYRLSANNPTPEGVFREFSLPAMAEVNWEFAPQWKLQAGVGTNLYERFDLNDKDGNDVAHTSTSFAPLFLLGIQWDF